MIPGKGTLSNKNIETVRIEPGSVVEYQQHGKSIIGLVLSSAKDKWQLINETGSEVYLPGLRLSLLGKSPSDLKDLSAKTSFLQKLSSNANELCHEVNLEEIWTLLQEGSKSVSENDILEIAFTKHGLLETLAIRRTLLADTIYFKRDKSGNAFEPRRQEIVEELKLKSIADQGKARERQGLISALVAKVTDSNIELPSSIENLENLAALASKAPNSKETHQLLDDLCEQSNLFEATGKYDERAFKVLVKIGHFRPDENLSLYRCDRSPRFSQALEQAAQKTAEQLTTVISDGSLEDLTHLSIFSIDSITTRDVDDALSLEETQDGIRIGIHITDVASFLKPGSVLYEEAIRRATSLYCPDDHISMLPKSLSENALSLLEGQDRSALSFFVDIDRGNNITGRKLIHGKLRVKHKLNYDEVDDFLFDETKTVHLPTPGLEKSILALYEVTSWLETARIEAGAMQFQRRELLPVIGEDGVIRLEPNTDETPARKLVSELMILANETAAMFARDHAIPILFRSQEKPDVEPSTQALDVPEGPARDFLQRAGLKRSVISTDALSHFGLGLQAYTQVTSPIRRAADLVTQHQLISYIETGSPCFSKEEVDILIARIEEGSSEAFELQRERNRYWLLKYLIQEKVKLIEGTVMKTDSLRPLAELDTLFLIWPYEPLEKKKVGPYRITTNPGERVLLKIAKIDPSSVTLRLQEVERQ